MSNAQFPALADVGLPMLFIEWPLMVCALIPVILIESAVIKRYVTLSNQEAYWGVTKANVKSTLLRVPLAWLTTLAIEFVTVAPTIVVADKMHWKLDSPAFEVIDLLLGNAWIGDEHLGLVIPAALAVFLVPTFFLSVWFETRSCLSAWKTSDPAAIRLGVFRANLASYAFLVVLTCIWLGHGILTGQH